MAKACAGWGLVIAVYVAVAASTFGGFFSKWAFRDDSTSHSLVATMDGSAARPFVYRQLIPYCTEVIARSLPDALAASITDTSLRYPHISDAYTKAIDAKDPRHALKYRIAFYLVFLAWLGALGLLALVCHQATGHVAASTIAPLVFAHLFPFLQTRGGYFYDPVEVGFLAASVLIACGRYKLLVVLLAPVAMLNKEAFLLWLPCLIPFFWDSREKVKELAKLGAAMALAAGVYYMVRLKFASNIGGPMEDHFIENLKFYATPSSYFGVEYTYGLPFPRGVAVPNLLGVSLLIWLAWQQLATVWRRHLLLACAINLPLLIAFCWRDELRNLSFLFVGFVVLVAAAIAAALDRTRPPAIAKRAA